MSDPASAARFQRASALEEKRRKLDELKKKREVRGTDTARIQATQTTTNLDEYIDDLLKDSSGSTTAATSAAAAVTNVDTIDGKQVSDGATPNEYPNENGTSFTAASSTTATTTTTATATTNSAATNVVEQLRKQIEVFSISTQTEDELLDDADPIIEENDELEPKKKKSTQESHSTNSDTDNSNANNTNNIQPAQHQHTITVPPKVLSVQEVEREVTKPPFSLFLNTASKKVERMLVASTTTNSMATAFVDPPPLQHQEQNYNDDILLADYVTESMDIDRKKEQQLLLRNTDSHHMLDTKFVSSKVIYECPKWTTHRDVTDLDWSPIHRELLLSTYYSINSAVTLSTSTNMESGNISNAHTAATVLSSSSLTPRSGELLSDGLALIWSPMLPNRPEHVFTCGTPVMCGKFHPTDPTLIIGGCYSGQLVIWDIRSGRLPVQKSSIPTVVATSTSSSSSSTNAPPLKGHHAHSIGSMEVLDGGLSLVTASADGRLNFWSMTNLRDPAESIQVGDSISCLAVLPESETLVVGDEHGTMYTVASPNTSTTTNHSIGSGDTNTTTSSGKNSPVPPSSNATLGGGGLRVSRRQVKKMEMSSDDDNHLGHYGMITSLSAKLRSSIKGNHSSNLLPQSQHMGTTSKGFFRGIGGLLVSSGVDWTVKLWGPAYHSDKPLMSYVSHSYDYMSDVAWSTTHPSLFATASSNGSIGLWNLATSLDEPITGSEGIVVQPDAMSSGVGLNKIKWSSDGRRLAVASSDKVHVLQLSDDVTRTKGDEETKVMNQLLTRGLI